MKNPILTVIVFVLLTGGYPLTSPRAQTATVPLPKPQTEGGRPLMQPPETLSPLPRNP